ncbi:MAG: DUF732 domain-containing protein [Acidimicrobiales bacterium]
MCDNTTLKSTWRTRQLLASAVGVTLLLLAGTACGTKSRSASAANSAASPAAPTVAARTDPSAEQVAVAIAQVKERIRMPVVPSEGHVRSFGDAACSAFDQGKTAPQVRGLVLQAASQLPSITVSAADADFAVGTAVNLFCPAYSSKLVP